MAPNPSVFSPATCTYTHTHSQFRLYAQYNGNKPSRTTLAAADAPEFDREP